MPNNNEIYDAILGQISLDEPDLKLIEKLLEKETFDINARKNECSLLDHAVLKGSVRICELVIRTQKLNQESLNRALLTTFSNDFIFDEGSYDIKFYEICKVLLSAGAEIQKGMIASRIFARMPYLNLEEGLNLLRLFLAYLTEANDFDSEHGYDIFTSASRVYSSEPEKELLFNVLMEYPINPELTKTIEGYTALMYLAERKELRLCKLLLNYGADLTMKFHSSLNAMGMMEMFKQEIQDLFIKKIKADYPEIMEDGEILETMEERDRKDTPLNDLDKALFRAIFDDDLFSSNEEKILELLRSGVKVNSNINRYGGTPLHCAKTIKAAQLLIDHGADVNAKNNFSEPVIYLVMDLWKKTNEDNNFDIELMSFLLSKGADIQQKTKEGDTVLHKAALWGIEELVSLFLERGANPNEIDIYGKTPLHRAAQKEELEVIKILLSKGANPNLKCRLEKTALDYAYTPKVRKILTEAMQAYEAATASSPTAGAGRPSSSSCGQIGKKKIKIADEEAEGSELEDPLAVITIAGAGVGTSAGAGSYSSSIFGSSASSATTSSTLFSMPSTVSATTSTTATSEPEESTEDSRPMTRAYSKSRKKGQ